MILDYFNNLRKSPKGYRLATTVFFFISGFGYSSWASRIPAIKAQLHLSEAEFGAVLFAFPIGLMLTMPFTRRILNLFSSRYCMLSGAILFNIVLALPGFCGLCMAVGFDSFNFWRFTKYFELIYECPGIRSTAFIP